MSLQENIRDEERQLKDIFTAIEGGKSFIVHAGAGAGKTYTLIESIKYILSHKLNTLRKHNQKIICITYTNVAVDEIRHRLGESQFVQVSTIHEMLWQQIKLYQQHELIELHKNKLEKEIENTKSKITEQAEDSANLADINTEENKELFRQFVQENKDEFFKLEKRGANANKFREKMIGLAQEDLKSALTKALKNISDFKNFFRLINRLRSYMQALEDINQTDKNKKLSIEYDSNSNSDRLASMKFSHDTLLEYSLQLVKKYNVFKKLLTDQYPYIFIDEYQDTNESVIKLMAYLQQYAHPERWLVGYFGDSKQNIYDSGVGNHIENIYREISAEGKKEIKLEKIVKDFNRRSQIQIINLINKIRNDELAQKPIDPDRTNGKVEFYCLKAGAAERDKDETIIDQFIAHLALSLPDNEQINCLLLLNRSVASMSGFAQLYNAIEKAKFIKHDNLNSMLLSRILNKLHPAVLRLYQLVTAYNSLNNPHTTLYDLFGNTQHSVTFTEAGELVKILKQQQPPATLNEFIQNISTGLNQLAKNKNKSESDAIQFWLKNCFGINYPKDIKQNNAGLADLSFADYYINFLLYEDMYGSINHAETEVEETDDVVATNQQHISDILDIDLSKWQRWVDFIDDHAKEQQVIYHTYHGTKGEEYDNVVIIMENDFGRKQINKFKNYFSSLSADANIQVKDEEDKELENTRNLFYTACSRARKNLWILYLDDITEIKDKIELLFGTVNTFEPAIE
ncbi:ATP-dependent helicase [Snodgrassella sp.]|uniref:ATP-dependent helicase n=1 Tax=Snodgrassella sp. TaxID=2815304 RepID=UPI00258F544F|nr:ATP-dependent helicase [Snodgrassella sp.]MCO6517602.1 ATP-dependent helicase [Snodgrassella sp.]